MKKYMTMAAVALFLMGCADEENTAVPVNEEEVITKVALTLEDPAGEQVVLIYEDLDGDGPNAPVVAVEGNLQSNTLYSGSAAFVNQMVTPWEDITHEIEEEGEDHQIFYSINSGLGSFTYQAPFDTNGNPIGTHFQFQTAQSGSGTLTVVLRHHPDKFATGVSTGQISAAGGDTDIQVSFPVVIQ